MAGQRAPFDPSQPLRSARAERAAINLVRGKSRRDAMVEAGYRIGPKSHSATCRFFNQPNVLARVEWLQKEAARAVVEQNAGTRDWIKDQLVRNVTAAKESGDLKAVNQALFYLGKEAGMFVDRQIVANLEREIDGKSEEEIVAFLHSLVDELGESTMRAVLRDRTTEPDGRDDGSSASGPDAGGADAEPSGALSAVPEADGVPRSRLN